MKSLRNILFAGFIVFNTACSSQPIEKNIVLVGVDTIDREGIAKLVGLIEEMEPKVLSIDIQFVNETEHRKDWLLFSRLTQCKNLVMAKSIWNYTGNENEYHRFFNETEPQFLVNASTGFTNAILEDDDVHTLTRFAVAENVNGRREYHFGVVTAKAFDSVATAKFLEGNKRIIDLDFKRSRSFKKYSYSDFFNNSVVKNDISGKIVMLGYLGPENLDMFFTPLNQSSKPKYPDMYGLEYLANVVAQILEYKYTP